MKSPCIALALTIAAMIPGAATDAAEPVTFIRDVLPAMNKVGCSNGTCHGAAKGKNGFKLSLRGYDPEFDYQSLLYDMSGRRFNRADPERSLMLAKPTMQVPHEGGLRLDLGAATTTSSSTGSGRACPTGIPRATGSNALSSTRPRSS